MSLPEVSCLMGIRKAAYGFAHLTYRKRYSDSLRSLLSVLPTKQAWGKKAAPFVQQMSAGAIREFPGFSWDGILPL